MTTDSKHTVLVTSSGTIVGQGIIKSLKLANSQKDHDQKYRIIAADMNALTDALYRSDIGVLLPQISSPEYIQTLVGVCKEEDVEAVFLGAEEELRLMAQAKERIERETGAVVISNTFKAIETGLDKWRTYEFLKSKGLPCPESSLPDDPEGFARNVGFPLMVKPREGHASIHLHLTNNMDEVKHAISAIENAGWHPLLQEYLPQDDLEYTTGVTINAKGKQVLSSIAMRRTLKYGQTWKAFIDEFPDVRRTAEEAALKLGGRGPVNVQGRTVNGELKIFEINPRFSGSCPLRAAAGVNEPDIIFRNWVMSEEVTISSYRKLVCMRYFDEVYIPLSAYEESVKRGRVEGAESFNPEYF